MAARFRREWILPGAMVPLALAGVFLLALPEEWQLSPTLLVEILAPAEAEMSAASVRERQDVVGNRPPSGARSEKPLVGRLRASEGLEAKLEVLDRFLAKTPKDQGVAALARLLHSPLHARTVENTRSFRLGVIARLGRCRSPRVVGHLLAIAATLEDPQEDRLAALDALRGRQDEKTALVLQALADRDADPEVRERARALLGAS